MKQEGQDVATCGGGRGQAESEVRMEVTALQKSVEQCLGLAPSRWGRTGRAGPGCHWQPRCAQGLWKGQVWSPVST